MSAPAPRRAAVASWCMFDFANSAWTTLIVTVAYSVFFREAVVGAADNLGDHGSSRVHPPYVVTPLAGLQKLLSSSAQVHYSSGKKLDEAKTLATEADAVILVVGLTHKDEGEYIPYGPITLGGDRSDLRLHENEVALIQSIAPLNTNTVVVLIGGWDVVVEVPLTMIEVVVVVLVALSPGTVVVTTLVVVVVALSLIVVVVVFASAETFTRCCQSPILPS